MNSRVEAGTMRQLLADLADDNPPPEERWLQRDFFDPMHRLQEIRAAAKRGFIEVRETGDPETIQFRLTPAGRAALAKGESHE